MNPEAIERFHRTRSRYRCMTCRAFLTPKLERIARGYRVTVRCHGEQDTFTVSDSWVEDHSRAILWRFVRKPEHEFNRARLDRHGRSVDDVEHWQDVSDVPVYASADETVELVESAPQGGQ
jgi:hypothetical protein